MPRRRYRSLIRWDVRITADSTDAQLQALAIEKYEASKHVILHNPVSVTLRLLHKRRAELQLRAKES